MTEESVFDWSEEERQRAQTVLQSDARALNDTGRSERIVSPSECREWREEVKAAGGSPVNVDAVYDTSTVETHARGECRHSHAEVGVPVRYDNSRGEWVPARMVSSGCAPSNLDVYHTRVCKVYPAESIVLGSRDRERYEWRECRECTGAVPEAKPIPEANSDD